MTGPTLAYIAQGQLHLCEDGEPRTVESVFGRSLRERAIEIRNRNSWKAQGSGAQFMQGLLWRGQPACDVECFRMAITSVARGRNPQALLYSLETDEISGIIEVEPDGTERRVFHTSDFRLRHVALNPDGTQIACSVFANPVTANIAVLNVDGTEVTEVTDGDSVDLAPRWVPGARRLVFQSSGVGRDTVGRQTGLAPFTVNELDLDSREIECLAGEGDCDLVGPQMTADGALYYMRRPRKSRESRTHPLDVLIDALMMPFRLTTAIFECFNFFSMKYTGKPLITPRGAVARPADLKRLMIMGNLIDAIEDGRGGRPGAKDGRSLVPSSWQLLRRTSRGTELVAGNVLAFDVAPDGSVIYSTGSAVHRKGPSGNHSERILQAKMIEQVTAL